MTRLVSISAFHSADLKLTAMSLEQQTAAPTAASGPERSQSISYADAACLAPVETHVAQGAVKGGESEKAMTLLEGLKTYPKAVVSHEQSREQPLDL